MAELPSFDAFYEAVHGRQPFPWQNRLAALVAETGWPREIGVPTGLGKTSCIDIAVWSLAAQADRPARERTVPTRIWYVVNRRLLVDAASLHSERLAKLLDQPVDDALAAVAHRLRSLQGAAVVAPLRALRLRGGVANSRRPRHPGQPAIICATVPMFASRLMFRSYGSSNRMWPVDAALAGIDSLVLLDEAHLSFSLMDLVKRLEQCDTNQTGILRVPGTFEPTAGPASVLPPERARPVLVALTATGSDHERFDLDDADRGHPVVARRLSASKPTTTVATTVKELPKALAAEIVAQVENQRDNPAVLVFVNRPATARSVAAAIPPGLGDVVVLTGQLREPDADAVRRRLLDPLAGLPAGANPNRERPLIVIATQTLEVGADLDADVVVSESAGVRALVQRLGRLNRLGERSQACAVIVHALDAEPGLYGDEPHVVWERLSSLGEPVDLGPANISTVLGVPNDRGPAVPELLPVHLWELAKTSVPVADAAPWEAFVEGLDPADRVVAICWRQILPEPGAVLYPAVHDSEWVEVPIWDARVFVQRLGTDVWGRLSQDGASFERLDGERLRPGDRLVVNCIAGGYSPFGWDPDSEVTVADLSPVLCGIVALTHTTLEALLGRPLSETERAVLKELADDSDTERDTMLVQELAAVIDEERPDLGCVASNVTLDRVGVDAAPWLSWSLDLSTARVDSLDELSITTSAELSRHLTDVADMAIAIANAMGIAPVEADAIRQAAGFHDLGKADPRFQRWLGSSPDTLMAKSRMRPGRWQQARIAAAWPDGARHELLSVQLIDHLVSQGEGIDMVDLVRHLVAAHHGHARPSIDTSAASAPITTDVVIDDRHLHTSTDPGRPDWEQPERFRNLCETYGLWGLALMEAVVRQADHLVSAQADVQ